VLLLLLLRHRQGIVQTLKKEAPAAALAARPVVLGQYQQLQ
jgi:hypothetical protein